VVALVRGVQALPYIWPSDPEAAAAQEARAGSCASKHALLAEELALLGVESLPLLVVGPLVPRTLAADEAFAEGLHLAEVHECLTVLTPWTGPLRVDVTWDPPLIERGLPGTLSWGGNADMALAVGELGPCWSAPRERLREAKEGLRERLYAPGERQRRDRVLRALAERFEAWRAGLA
jgi:hypothetical protein